MDRSSTLSFFVDIGYLSSLPSDKVDHSFWLICSCRRWWISSTLSCWICWSATKSRCPRVIGSEFWDNGVIQLSLFRFARVTWKNAFRAKQIRVAPGQGALPLHSGVRFLSRSSRFIKTIVRWSTSPVFKNGSSASHSSSTFYQWERSWQRGIIQERRWS